MIFFLVITQIDMLVSSMFTTNSIIIKLDSYYFTALNCKKCLILHMLETRSCTIGYIPVKKVEENIHELEYDFFG